MCGRLTMHVDPQNVATELDVDEYRYTHRERYNVPPGSVLPIIVDAVTSGGEVVRRLETARWGLLPDWVKDPKMGFRAFNARSETVAEKPMFRRAFASRHCVIPIAGYYEWQATEAAKVPWLMSSGSQEPLLLAGLYEFKNAHEWLASSVVSPEDPALVGGWLLTVTVLTQQAQGSLAEVHDRMPAFLAGREQVDAWLEPGSDGNSSARCLHEIAETHFERQVARYRVSSRVGNVRDDDPSLIEAD